MQDWELVVELLWLRLLETFLGPVPSCTLEVETMDVNTFLWMVNGLALDTAIVALDDFLEHIR